MGKGRRNLIGTLDSGVRAVEVVVCSTVLAGMVAAISLQVLYRYVLNAPLDWSEEFARLGQVWITFIGASMMMGRKAHLVIDTLVLILPMRLRLALSLLIQVAIGGFLVVLIQQGLAMAAATADVRTPTGMPVALFYLALPSASVLMLLRSAILLVDTTGKLRAGGASEHRSDAEAPLDRPVMTGAGQ